MPEWFEMFPDERVLVRVRDEARRLVIVFAATSGALVAAAPLAAFFLPRGGTIAALACGAVLVIHAAWLVRRLARLHRTVWRVRLSARHFVADDARLHRTTMPWLGVVRVDLGEEALTVDGLCADGRAASVRVPVSFQSHTALARRVVDYAVVHRCVLCLDGEPLQTACLDGLLVRSPGPALDG